MPWNEPGKSSNNKDPWTGRPRQTPPDLEAILRDLRKKIAALLKLKTANKNKRRPRIKAFAFAQFNTKVLAGLLFGFLFLVWLFSGFFIVDSSAQAVITRFNKYSTTLSAGRHWIFKPFETYYIIPKKAIPFTYQTDLITQDTNKVFVSAKILYSIVNARQYLFANAQTLQGLQEATAQAIQQTLGIFSLKQLLTINPLILQQTLPAQIDQWLSKHDTGLTVNTVELATMQMPEALQATFEDAKRAHAEKEQLENQAKIYAMETVLNAQGQSERVIMAAKSYSEEAIVNAKAETARFLALLPAYEAAPLLTRKRLYAEMMQNILPYSQKILTNNPSTLAFSFNLSKPLLQNQEIPIKIPQATSVTRANLASLEKENVLKTKQGLSSSYDIAGGYE
jgi:modulator of FtsH protease HflK